MRTKPKVDQVVLAVVTVVAVADLDDDDDDDDDDYYGDNVDKDKHVCARYYHTYLDALEEFRFTLAAHRFTAEQSTKRAISAQSRRPWPVFGPDSQSVSQSLARTVDRSIGPSASATSPTDQLVSYEYTSNDETRG